MVNRMTTNAVKITYDILRDKNLVTVDELDTLPDKGVVTELFLVGALVEACQGIFRVNRDKLESWALDLGLGGIENEVDSR